MISVKDAQLQNQKERKILPSVHKTPWHRLDENDHVEKKQKKDLESARRTRRIRFLRGENSGQGGRRRKSRVVNFHTSR